MIAVAHGFAHWLSHWLGMDNGSGPVYLAWSGWGRDVAEIVLLIGRHTVMDAATGEHVVRCRRHHRQWKAAQATE